MIIWDEQREEKEQEMKRMGNDREKFRSEMAQRNG